MPFDSRSSTFTGAKPNCTLCPAHSVCIVDRVPCGEAAQWNDTLMPHVPLATAGKTLVEAGAAADSVYVVRAGCLKSFTVDSEGNERVRAFYLPGDIVGLDSLGQAHYPANVVAVSPSQVCRLPKTQVMAMLAKSPALMQRLVERTSRELAQALALSGDYTADQRVAAFLLLMKQRLDQKNGDLRLPMTRRDIANYLRLATETVCRVLGRFELRGWIQSSDKTLRIADGRALSGLAAPVGFATVAPALRIAA